jgi:hypothetical protein
MVSRPVLAAAWGMVLCACALDMAGLGERPLLGNDAGTVPPSDGSTADETSAPDAREDAAVVDTSVSIEDALAPTDTSPADAHPESAVGCDEDGDGYLSKTGGCGGNDCCDQDPHVHPGQESYFTDAGACGGYDYDCDGKETAEYGAADCEWSAFSCSGDGFAAPVPSCGAFGTFTSCSIPWYDAFTCVGANASQAQACR